MIGTIVNSVLEKSMKYFAINIKKFVKSRIRETKSAYLGTYLNFFFLLFCSHLEIITGKQEGIYQWIAINYVLDKFDAQSDNNIVNMPGDTNDLDDNNSVYIRPKTVGALDMGGASMQIAMEVTSDLSLQGFTVRI